VRIALNVVGVLCVLVGCVGILQGVNILPGSFMSGQIVWAIYGGVLGVVGIILLILASRASKGRRLADAPVTDDDTPGERFRALRDVTVQIWAEQGEAGSTVSRTTFPRGRILEIAGWPKNRTSIIAEPVDYEELEPLLVPPGDRKMPKYCGIYLVVVEIQQLREDFEPVAA
jgi:hypothetical protein